MAAVRKYFTKFTRRKTLDEDILKTPLSRCLNTCDITLLGLGGMIGAGIFILTGTVVRNMAGPGAILSYILAGFAALLSALCYAEFGAHVPRAGSAYTYSYVTMGECVAFIIGWNIILEHVVGAASTARAWSAALDVMLNYAIKNGTMEHVFHMHSPGLSEYPDFVALGIILLIMLLILSGAKSSLTFNNVLAVINVCTILLIIILGFVCADISNWTNKDNGGFLPYGFGGVISGAATCFYAYIGFEGIAVTGEEVKNPSRAIPMASGIAMTIVTFLYVGSTASLTLTIPYDQVNAGAPFPEAFARHGLEWAKYTVSVGAILGITTSTLSSLYTLPRGVYAMADDGLIFRQLAYVHPKSQTPIVAILVFGGMAGLLAFLFDIETLVEFLSIGTLLGFTIVAAGIIVLRYQPVEKCQMKMKSKDSPDMTSSEQEAESTSDKKQLMASSQSHEDIGKLKKRFKDAPVLKEKDPENTTAIAVVVMTFFMAVISVTLLFAIEYVMSATWWAVLVLILSIIGMSTSFFIIVMHEQNECFVTFQVPLVPFLPALSMWINITLMLKLHYLTWIRLAVWLLAGLIIYGAYGVRHSNENKALAEYNEVVSYGGGDKCDAIGNMDETIEKPQPDTK